ncbi:MAG: hypothetical protein AUJ92_01885 [Armatimonadetes bacterium CG2_30_59_28]|nr:hypothetical protein [Armatimonadota bacterium]OIO98255.1 MAG: hypothetical protein AUJ92_01885 [Armatimonadetes bacterium CG2_30_59_28]PIU62996.1 MAG: hypothetical protein COS85_16990 [Armatimonadetes bacterium CG07_land_8_20_14_0_80_59_28]PIX40428.1 MAG: hypothetical protein COZ56_14730 [Armatimonadetes bacterium CG_4_8_14_3_um_filter_58_9]PIY45236.1 MAG: hypothetical protein COZ05_06745 [Armatimonadetes bacterium CG_4_10_14_3_um_filter_59_10]
MLGNKLRAAFGQRVFVGLVFLCGCGWAAQDPKPDGKGGQEPPSATALAILEQAEKEGKHALVHVYRGKETDIEATQTLFSKLKESPEWQKKVLLYQLDVTAKKERAFVERYNLDYAPMPLILVFAPNGALVKHFPYTPPDEKQLQESLAGAKLAETLKALQEGKAVLLCVQSQATRHNAESLDAARQLAEEDRMKDVAAVVVADPADPQAKDIFSRFKLETEVEEATIHFIFAPARVAGKLSGPTTPDALYDALLSPFRSGGGCCGK